MSYNHTHPNSSFVHHKPQTVEIGRFEQMTGNYSMHNNVEFLSPPHTPENLVPDYYMSTPHIVRSNSIDNGSIGMMYPTSFMPSPELYYPETYGYNYFDPSFVSQEQVMAQPLVHSAISPKRRSKSMGSEALAMPSVFTAELLNRPFQCEHPGCGKMFKRSEHKKRHFTSLHTSIRPYECKFPECGKTFARTDNLAQHEKVHRNHLGPLDPTSQANQISKHEMMKSIPADSNNTFTLSEALNTSLTNSLIMPSNSKVRSNIYKFGRPINPHVPY